MNSLNGKQINKMWMMIRLYSLWTLLGLVLWGISERAVKSMKFWNLCVSFEGPRIVRPLWFSLHYIFLLLPVFTPEHKIMLRAWGIPNSYILKCACQWLACCELQKFVSEIVPLWNNTPWNYISMYWLYFIEWFCQRNNLY